MEPEAGQRQTMGLRRRQSSKRLAGKGIFVTREDDSEGLSHRPIGIVLSKAEGFVPVTIVLAVGFNQLLLSTRNLVLQSAGYIVESASSPKEAIDRFQSGDFDLVLLCHSVSIKDREHLTTLIRASGSQTPIVSIARNHGECDAFANATLEDSPNNLLAGIREVLVKAEKTPPWAAKYGNR